MARNIQTVIMKVLVVEYIDTMTRNWITPLVDNDATSARGAAAEVDHITY